MAALALAVLANNGTAIMAHTHPHTETENVHAEINQLELNKLNVCEILIRHLAHDDLNVNRNCVAALTSLCLNG